MSIITVGIDLAKNVFAVHGVDDNGKPALVKPKVSREHLLPLIAQLPPCLIGMEACSGAHHWARLFRQHGHTVKLMAPKFVIPYRLSGKRGKNDAADAAAICEAVTRPAMRFVPVKEEHQQVILALHRTRTGFIEERTATYNRLRGLISEFGIVCPQKIANLRRALMDHLEDLPGYVNRCVGDLLAHADSLDARIAEYDRIIAQARPGGAGRRPQPAADELAGDRPQHRQRHARQHRRRARLQERPPGGGLDRAHARAVQQRRDGPPGTDHQGRRLVPAQPVGDGSQGGPQWPGGQTGSVQSLGAQPGRASGLLEGGGGDCRQECAAGLGGAAVR